MTIEARCPAAELLAGPPTTGPATLCRAMVRDSLLTDQILHGAHASPLTAAREDPTVFFGFCCGVGLPRVADELGERTHGHYTFCPIWEAEKQRIWEEQEMMRAPRRPGPSPAMEAVLSGSVRDLETGDAIEEWMNEERPRA